MTRFDAQGRRIWSAHARVVVGPDLVLSEEAVWELLEKEATETTWKLGEVRPDEIEVVTVCRERVTDLPYLDPGEYEARVGVDFVYKGGGHGHATPGGDRLPRLPV